MTFEEFEKENLELKKQIEKMKCCKNCRKRFSNEAVHCSKTENGKVAKYDKWEIEQ